MCHVECCAGLGGEVICVYSDDEDAIEIGTENDTDISLQPVLCKSTPVNTKASEVFSETQLRRSRHVVLLPPPPSLGPDLRVSSHPPGSHTSNYNSKLTDESTGSLPNLYFTLDNYYGYNTSPIPPLPSLPVQSQSADLYCGLPERRMSV